MKIKHIILFVICLIAVTLLGLFFFALNKHNQSKEKISRIPSVELVDIDGETFRLPELLPERKTALLFFSHDCEFCQKEIQGILEEAAFVEGVIWVFVTPSQRDALEVFFSEFPINMIPDAKVCITESADLYASLDVSAPPAIFIYNKKGDLEFYHRGALSIKTIIEKLI